jgi:hypothetical protein
MASYILRTIDADLWREVKARAKWEGWPLRMLILALLRGYVDGSIVLTPATARDEAG